MSQNIRTIVFVAVGVVSIGAAFLVAHLTAPKPLDQFAKVGKAFYDDFDPNGAGSLELIAIPEGETKPKSFRVVFADGLWRIQTHHGYPADAKPRLAETTASVIGVQRVAMAGRGKQIHKKFGVVDPEQKDLDDPAAAGARIRILDKKKQTLVDLIIGKQAEEDDLKSASAAQDDGDETRPLHYVRRPDEQETYLARIELNVSTRFSDWIETDLLKLNAEDLRKIAIHNYKVRQTLIPIGEGQAIQRAVKADNEDLALSRDQDRDPWKLNGLDEKTESLKTEKITDIVSILDDMEILGVSPRLKRDGQTPLTGDLRLKPPKSMVGNLDDVIRLYRDVGRELDEKGFSLQLDLKNSTRKGLTELLKTKGAIPAQLLSQSGEFSAATKAGIVYHLHFGALVEGTETEIEFGGKAKKRPPKKKQPKGKKSKEAKSKKADPEPTDETHRRYVLVRVELDREEMEDRPRKPTTPAEPEKPLGYKELPKQDAKKDNKKANDAAPKSAEEKKRKPAKARRPGERRPALAVRPSLDDRYRRELKQYGEDMKRHATDLKRYNDEVKEFEKEVEKSQQIVDRLNERFAGWYYVVSTQSLQQLTLTRKNIVGPKSAAKTSAPKFPAGLKFPGMR